MVAQPRKIKGIAPLKCRKPRHFGLVAAFSLLFLPSMVRAEAMEAKGI